MLTNSFNLLDNMDGAAAAVAVGSACLIAAAAYLGGQGGLALLLISLSAACLGFLVHNWAPAGCSWVTPARCSSASSWRRPPSWSGCPADPRRGWGSFLFTFVATVDTCLVMIARPRAGLSCFTAGPTTRPTGCRR